MNRRSFVGFVLGPIVSAFIGLVTVPVVAWAYPTEEVARFNLFQFGVTFLLLLSTLGLDQAFAREYHEHTDKPSLLRACLSPSLAIAALIVLGGALTANRLSVLVFAVARPLLVYLTLVAFALSLVGRFLSLSLRMEERGLVFSIAEVLPKVVVVVLLVPLVLIGASSSVAQLQALTVLSLLAGILVSGWNTRALWRTALKRRVPAGASRPLLALALPLLVASLAYWGLTATGVVALRRWSTLKELADFALAMSVANAAALLQAVFTVVWAPIVYRWVGTGADVSRIDQVADKVAAVVCAAFVGFGLGAPLLDVLLPAKYAQVRYLVLCTIVPPLLYTISEVTGIGIVIARRTTLASRATLFAFGCCIALSALLVPRLGARGAVIANALSFVVYFVGRTEASARVWRPVRRRRLYTAIGSIVALSVATAAAGAEAPRWFLGAWAVAGVGVAFGFGSTWRALSTDLTRAWSAR